MYDLVFYHYYCFARFLKQSIPGGLFHFTLFDSILLLSMFEFLNIVSIALFLKVRCVTTTYALDMALLMCLLMIVNALWFGSNQRHLKILKKIEEERKVDTFYSFGFTLVYSALTVFAFYKVYKM